MESFTGSALVATPDENSIFPCSPPKITKPGPGRSAHGDELKFPPISYTSDSDPSYIIPEIDDPFSNHADFHSIKVISPSRPAQAHILCLGIWLRCCVPAAFTCILKYVFVYLSHRHGASVCDKKLSNNIIVAATWVRIAMQNRIEGGGYDSAKFVCSKNTWHRSSIINLRLKQQHYRWLPHTAQKPIFNTNINWPDVHPFNRYVLAVIIINVILKSNVHRKQIEFQAIIWSESFQVLPSFPD